MSKLTTKAMLRELRTLEDFEWLAEPGDNRATIVARTFAAYAPVLAERYARKLQAALSAFPGNWQITLTTTDRLGDFGFRPIR